MSHLWEKERADKLKRLAALGDSAREIARALGDGTTRNMVIGKAKRMGVKLHGQTVGRLAPRVRG